MLSHSGGGGREGGRESRFFFPLRVEPCLFFSSKNSHTSQESRLELSTQVSTLDAPLSPRATPTRASFRPLLPPRLSRPLDRVLGSRSGARSDVPRGQTRGASLIRFRAPFGIKIEKTERNIQSSSFACSSRPHEQNFASNTRSRQGNERLARTPVVIFLRKSERTSFNPRAFFFPSRSSRSIPIVEQLQISNDSPDRRFEGKEKPQPSLAAPENRRKTKPPCRCPRTSTACPSRRAPGSPARTRRCRGSRASSATGERSFFFLSF